MKKLAIALLLGSMASIPTSASAQDQGESIITVLHAAPGKYYDLVKWMAQIDQIRAEAGLAPRVIYRHHNGANWDFLMIEPPVVPDEGAKMMAAAKKLGIKPAPGAFRTLVMDHEDTIVGGPTTATAVLAEMDS